MYLAQSQLHQAIDTKVTRADNLIRTYQAIDVIGKFRRNVYRTKYVRGSGVRDL